MDQRQRTVRLIDETQVGIGTNASDAVWFLERGTNAANFLNCTTNGVLMFQVASNGNLAFINGVPYVWPLANAVGALTNNGSGVLGWDANLVGGGGSGITNLFSPTLSNATIKPLVVGVGNAAGATNSTGEIRGWRLGRTSHLPQTGATMSLQPLGVGVWHSRTLCGRTP